jgi:hypothetical protein
LAAGNRSRNHIRQVTGLPGRIKQLLDALGGPGNVSHLGHCSTRLRFTLAETGQVLLVREVKSRSSELGGLAEWRVWAVSRSYPHAAAFGTTAPAARVRHKMFVTVQ